MVEGTFNECIFVDYVGMWYCIMFVGVARMHVNQLIGGL